MKAKKVLVLALSMLMVLAMSASVFAAGTNSNKSGGDTSYSASEAKIVKNLIAPEGVTIPDVTFTFRFTPTTGDASNYAVKPGEFEETTATIKTNQNPAQMTANGVEGNLVGSKSIADIFDGYNFPHAGEYTFNVTEDDVTLPSGDEGTMTKSTESYKLRLLVDRNGNITDVTVQKGTDSAADSAGDKVDATDVTPSDNTDPNNSDATPSTSDSLGGFTFTNNYTKTVSNHDEPKTPNPSDGSNPSSGDKDPDKKPGAFALTKYVNGQYGDTTKGFKFNVTVVLPDSNKNFDLNTTGAITVAGETSTGWANKATKEVTLTHNQKLVFGKLPVGTHIKVKELAGGEDGYTTNLTTPTTTASAKAEVDVLITEDGGYTITQNNFDDQSVTPTGIIINNLPYVLLIGLALGGIVLFSRKRRYE